MSISEEQSHALFAIYFFERECRGFPERSRDIVISTCVADGVSSSFVFCRDSCTPPGPDGPGRIPHGPDNGKKKTKTGT